MWSPDHFINKYFTWCGLILALKMYSLKTSQHIVIYYIPVCYHIVTWFSGEGTE